jgi:LuxR family quorum-sensing system transcriptional regulator CciR
MGRFRDVEAFVQRSREIGDLEKLRLGIEDVAREFGLRYFLLAHHVSVLGPNIVQLGNYPDDWANTMRTKRHFTQDPVIHACQKTAAPFLWSELDRIIQLSSAQRKILEDVRKAGFGAAFTVPIHIPGECIGSGSFAVTQGKRFDRSVIPLVQYVASFAFEAARRLALKPDQLRSEPAAAPGLTQRQLDCIVLMAQGKSDWDVGKILGISRRTVQEHIDAARKRYGVASRMQLIVRMLFDSQVGFQDIIRV